MKQLLLTFKVLALIMPSLAFAGDTEFNDCILKHLKGAKLDIASHLIKQACDENHRTRGFIADKKRAYNDCLLEHLVGVESLQAVVDIKAACYRKHL